MRKMACDICGSNLGEVLYRIEVLGNSKPIYACKYCIIAIAEYAIKKGLIKKEDEKR